MRTALSCLGLLLTLGGSADAAPPAASVAAHNATLAISFRHPAGWRIAPCDGTPRCIALRGRMGRRMTELMQIQAVDAPLETAARDEAGFELKNGRWMTTYGRFEPVAVQNFRSGSLDGMKAVITCGVGDGNGFHAAAGQCLWVVLSDGHRSIVASSEGLTDPKDDLATLSTVTFDKP